MNRLLLVFFISLLVSGCATLSKARFLTTAILHPTPPHIIELSDGYKATYYTFTVGDKDRADTCLFFVTGSGNASAQFTRHYLKDLPGNVKVFALQKRYVSHWETGIFDPSEEFNAFYRISNLRKDHLEFVKYILSRETAPAKKIIVLGVSEGGSLAPAIAAGIPEITHMVVLGDGGMKGIDAFRIWGSRNGIDFDNIYDKARSGPQNQKLFGYTNSYWLDMLEDAPMDYLRNLNIPVYYGIGEKDDSMPVESVYYLRDEFDKLGKHNLTVKIYPDCDHRLVDANGNSHRKQFLTDISSWWTITNPASGQ